MKKICLVSYLLLLLGGKIIYGIPTGPDSPAGWWPMAGAFLLFLAFLLTAFMWGYSLTRFLLGKELSVPLSMASGLGFFILLGQVIGLAGGLGYFPSLWMTLLFWGGAIVFLVSPKMETCIKHFANRTGILSGALLFAFFFALSWIPDSMPDPLWNNLTAARTWMNHGGYAGTSANISLFQAGSWDALLLWGNFLLGVPTDGGLIAVQIFGQWLHLSAALIAAILLIDGLSHLLPKLSPSARYCVVVAAVLSAAQIPSVALAKNDWGASLFLFAWFAQWAKSRSAKDFILAGIFLGMAFSTKPSVTFSAVILLGAWVASDSRPSFQKCSGWLFAGGVVAALPWLWRNEMATGNPVFPSLNSIFGGAAGPSWQKFSLYYEGRGGGWNSYIGKDILRDSPFILAGPLFLTVAAIRGHFRRFKAEGIFCSLSLLAVFFFWIKAGVKAEYRLFGPGCLLLIASSLGAALSICANSKIARYLPAACALISVAYLSLFFQFPWRAPFQAFAQPRPAEVIRTHFGGTVLAWVRLHIPLEKIVASANEHRLYYLSDREAFRIWDKPSLDRALYQARSMPDILEALEKEKIDYLIVTRLDWDLLFRKEVLDVLEAAWRKHPEAAIFGNEHSALLDVAVLRSFYPAEDHRVSY